MENVSVYICINLSTALSQDKERHNGNVRLFLFETQSVEDVKFIGLFSPFESAR